MSIERYIETVPQSSDAVPVQLPIERGPGNFLLFQSSLASVTVTLFYDGVREVFANVNGGVFVRRRKPWQNMRIDGVIGTQCTFFYGSDTPDKDETDIRQQVAVLAGVSAVADQPAATLTDLAPVVCGNAAQTIVAPVNNARRRITLSVDSAATGAVFARKTGGVNSLLLMQPGMSYQFNGSYGLDVRNDTGAGATIYRAEES